MGAIQVQLEFTFKQCLGLIIRLIIHKGRVNFNIPFQKFVDALKPPRKVDVVGGCDTCPKENGCDRKPEGCLERQLTIEGEG